MGGVAPLHESGQFRGALPFLAKRPDRKGPLGLQNKHLVVQGGFQHGLCGGFDGERLARKA